MTPKMAAGPPAASCPWAWQEPLLLGNHTYQPLLIQQIEQKVACSTAGK